MEELSVGYFLKTMIVRRIFSRHFTEEGTLRANDGMTTTTAEGTGYKLSEFSTRRCYESPSFAYDPEIKRQSTQ